MKNTTTETFKHGIAKPMLCDVLIHYGNNKFDEDLFLPIKNKRWEKPDGGLWTSPKNSKWGWKDWCISECYMDCSDDNCFEIMLKKTANILKIDNENDFKNAPLIDSEYNSCFLDFEKIAEKYDAIWVTAKAVFSLRMNRKYSLYSWDCESVLILNKDCLQTQSLVHIA